MTPSQITERLTAIVLQFAPEYKDYHFRFGDSTNIPLYDPEIGWSQMKLRNSDRALLSVTLEPGAAINGLTVTFQ